MKEKVLYKRLSPVQILAFGGFILLSIASLCSLLIESIWADYTLIPNPKVVIPVANVFSTVLAVFVFFFPKKHFLLYFVLFFQSTMTAFTGYENLSVFLFSLFIILFFLQTSLSHKRRKKAIILFYILYGTLLTGCIPFGLDRFWVALGSTLFSASAFICVLKLFRVKLAVFIPAINQHLFISPEINLPKPGEILHLADYSLSERQINFLYESIVKNKSYGEISVFYGLSKSLVKKEMCSILDVFSCKNMESLKIVFSQFQVEKA